MPAVRPLPPAAAALSRDLVLPVCLRARRAQGLVCALAVAAPAVLEQCVRARCAGSAPSERGLARLAAARSPRGRALAALVALSVAPGALDRAPGAFAASCASTLAALESAFALLPV